MAMPIHTSGSTTDLASREALVDVIRFLHAKGWTPATSSNFSCRMEEEPQTFSVSVSGLDKGLLTTEDFIEVDFSGQVINPAQAHLRPSAETLLHAVVYRLFPSARFVLHTHSVEGTVLSKLYEFAGGLWLKDFEMLKAFEGIKTHEAQIWLPVFSNAQDMKKLSTEIESLLPQYSPVYGYMLAGHGLYTLGETASQAKRHAEVFEFLFDAILKLRSYGYPDYSG
jgi:methylthioribulose-1-phosphate dehydratase